MHLRVTSSCQARCSWWLLLNHSSFHDCTDTAAEQRRKHADQATSLGGSREAMALRARSHISSAFLPCTRQRPFVSEHMMHGNTQVRCSVHLQPAWCDTGSRHHSKQALRYGRSQPVHEDVHQKGGAMAWHMCMYPAGSAPGCAGARRSSRRGRRTAGTPARSA